MPTSAEVQKAISKPQLSRLKSLGEGLEVGAVMGNRVLIKKIQPFTDLDRVEKEGRLYIPPGVKKDNTPLPSTGIVIGIGRDVSAEDSKLLDDAAVLFSKFAGHDFVVEGEDLMILDVSEVLCTIILKDKIVPVLNEE